jgi:anionic cell wall polymer biosynthesis LytR-Cps2A-Psr (LCP) family protein
MDGETALKFVRSRNAEGDEGTDFARQKRQQRILKGIEEKILSREILFSPKKMVELKSAVLSSIETDIEQSEAAVLARNMFSSRENIVSAILPENLLVNPPKSAKYDNLYVFVPLDGEWLGIHKWVSCVLENGQCP